MAIEIDEYVAPVKENPFADDVEQLAKAQATTDKQLVGKITVPEKDAKKAKFKISRAANEQGYTAFHGKEVEDLGDGNVQLTFRLGPKQKPRRRKVADKGE